jgi:hypothetical protein
MMKTFLVFLYQSLVWAAPHPLTASSIINNPQNNFAYSMMGFKVSSVPTGWVYKNSPEENGMSIEMGPSDVKSKASLIFHVENVAKKTNLEQYVRQYLRDYNQYGFEVVGLQSNKKNTVPSVIVDLTQKNKQTRSRQVFFIQNEKIVVASCLDNFDSFDKTVASCNQILGSFQWNKPEIQ